MKFKPTQKLTLLIAAMFLDASCNSQQQTPEDKKAETTTTSQPEQPIKSEIDKPQQSSELTQLRILDLTGNILADSNDEKLLESFYVNWQLKTQVTFIKQPEMPFQLDLFIEGKKQSWMFDGKSVVTQSAKGSSAYYQLKSAEMLSTLLSKQAIK